MSKFEMVGKLSLIKDTDKRKCFENIVFKAGERKKDGTKRKDDFIMRKLRMSIKCEKDNFNVDINGNLFGNESSAVVKVQKKKPEGGYEPITFKYKDREKHVGEVAEFNKYVFVNKEERHEFVTQYDYAKFMYDLLQSGELDDKVVKVMGDIVYSDYTNPNTGETKTYTNYEANRIYVVKDDAPRVATSNMTLLIGEDAISDDELEETGVFKVSGYETVYVSREQPNKGVFKVLEYPLGIDDKEKMHKKFEIIKRLLRVEDCELAKIGFKVNLINRTEEVEFDESMLTDEEKEYIEFGIMSLDDFKQQYGKGKGSFVSKLEIQNINPTYRQGAIPTELTLADILSVPEKKEELTGGLVEVDMGDDDLGLFGDDDPFGDGDIPF